MVVSEEEDMVPLTGEQVGEVAILVVAVALLMDSLVVEDRWITVLDKRMKLPTLAMDMSEFRSLDNNVAVLLMFILPWHLLLVSYPRQGFTLKSIWYRPSGKPEQSVYPWWKLLFSYGIYWGWRTIKRMHTSYVIINHLKAEFWKITIFTISDMMSLIS